jgi:amino acid transporter
MDGWYSYSESLAGGWPRWMFIAVITVLLTYAALLGLKNVSYYSHGILLFITLPFAVMCLLGVPRMQPERWLEMPEGGIFGGNVNWTLLLNTFFWNINYWESTSCFSGEVHTPAKVIPKGIFLALAMVVLSLLLPVAIGTAASSFPDEAWRDGFFVRLAGTLGGQWLAGWLLLASAVTNIGQFMAEMGSDAWQVITPPTQLNSTQLKTKTLL